MWWRKQWRNLDLPFLLAAAAILAMSLLVLSSASANVAEDSLFYVKRQLLWIGCGTVLALGVVTVDYRRLGKLAPWLYAATLLMLLAVLAVGSEARGAQRWIGLGPFLFQPSEFAKILVVITLSDFLARRQGQLKRLRDLVPVFVYVGLPMLLIMRQPDLGTSLVLAATSLGMLFMAGANVRLLLWLSGGTVAAACGALLAHFHLGLPLPLEDYQIMRLVVFLDPYADGQGGRGAGYHIIQSLVAIGAGGPFGQGYRRGSQVQLNFLPEHHTDFIFSVVGEEFGFVGAAFLLGLYFLLLYRALLIAAETDNPFGRLIIAGIISMFAFHLLVNVGMTMGIMPITGIPLPLFSYGGSSMLMNMLALGLIVNINLRHRRLL
ncbi:MAG: rod shape-determining protein RodA, partial [Clostridia bacterium]|nr:rod shape-determining protein RodA [Clostridia bacterium]